MIKNISKALNILCFINATPAGEKEEEKKQEGGKKRFTGCCL